MSFEIDDHVTRKYDVRRRIGKGAYGIVWKSVDRRTGEIVALKKIFDAFTNATDAQRTFREILFLQAFAKHANVIKLLNVIRASNDKDIYLAFEFMDTDLHAVIKAKILQYVHIQYIMAQMFRVMKYIHSGNVIHRDLKPSNILINSQCFIKLADFGLARSLALSDEEKKEEISFNPAMTDYVATRWYRSPEILLGSRKYTKGVDMWSLGCILAEMITSKPLYPGTSTMNQLDRIMATLPPPTLADVESIHSPYAQAVLEKIVQRRHKTLADILPLADDVSLDLMGRLLKFNPDRRSTADQCLTHSFVAKFHEKEKEPVVGNDIIPVLSDNVQLSVEDYRQQLYKDIVLRHVDLHTTTVEESPAHQSSGSQTPIVEDCESQVASPSPQTPVAANICKETTPSRKSNSRLLSRSRSTGQQHTDPSHPIPQYYSHATPPRQPRPSQMHSSMGNTHSPSSTKPRLMKQSTSTVNRHSRNNGCDRSPIDLMVTSARMIPVSRPTQWKEANKKAQQKSSPSSLAYGMYTQAQSTTSGKQQRSADLQKLTHIRKNNNW